MFVKYLEDCPEVIAGDGSILRELLHPAKVDLQVRYSLAHVKVPAGQRTKPHRLKMSEVYYVIEGQGLMYIDDQSCEVAAECAIYVPPESVQYIENTSSGDLKFLCIVDPAWTKQDEEVLDSA